MPASKDSVKVVGDKRAKLLYARADDLTRQGYRNFIGLLKETNLVCCRPPLSKRVINTIYWHNHYLQEKKGLNDG